MNKKILIIGGVFFLVVLALLLGLLSKPQTNSGDDQEGNVIVTPVSENNTSSYNNSSDVTDPQTEAITYVVPTDIPPYLSPEEVTEEFYIYFFTKNNPLANGGYKTNKYLSQEFKETVGALYENGDTPVFCPQNKRSAVSIGKRQEVYNRYGTLVQLVITESGGQNKDMYRLLLKQENGYWVIFDINCIR